MVNFVHSRPILYKIENEVSFDLLCFKPDDFDKSYNNNILQTLLLGGQRQIDLYVFNLT